MLLWTMTIRQALSDAKAVTVMASRLVSGRLEIGASWAFTTISLKMKVKFRRSIASKLTAAHIIAIITIPENSKRTLNRWNPYGKLGVGILVRNE